MTLGPSNRVRQLFWQKISERLASNGEPAALGKSASGPVYYTDYDGVVHKNRVWFRSGANKEVVGVARADNQGMPNVPDLPIKVADMFGGSVVVDWQRENPAATPATGLNSGIHRFSAWAFGPPNADSVTNPTFTWYYKYATGVNGSEVVAYFVATRDSTEMTIEFWWYDLASSGDVVWSVAFSTEADGENLGNSWERSLHTVTSAGQFSLNREVFTFSFSSNSFSEGDLVQVHIARRGADASDTSGADAGFVHATVYEEGTYSA